MKKKTEKEKEIARLLRRAKKLQSQIEFSKTLYKDLDEVIAELNRLKFKSNDKAVLIDEFKNKEVVFRTTSVRRYKLEFIK